MLEHQFAGNRNAELIADDVSSGYNWFPRLSVDIFSAVLMSPTTVAFPGITPSPWTIIVARPFVFPFPLLVMVSSVVFDEVHHVDWTAYCIVSYLLFSPAVFLTMLTMSITNVFRKDYIKTLFRLAFADYLVCSYSGGFVCHCFLKGKTLDFRSIKLSQMKTVPGLFTVSFHDNGEKSQRMIRAETHFSAIGKARSLHPDGKLFAVRRSFTLKEGTFSGNVVHIF